MASQSPKSTFDHKITLKKGNYSWTRSAQKLSQNHVMILTGLGPQA